MIRASVPGSAPLIDIVDVTKHFHERRGLLDRLVAESRPPVRAVDGVSFQVGPGECLGLVGESGCGKTTVARLILRIHDLTAGRILFDGADVHALRAAELKGFYRGLQMVFQDPTSSLNPRMRVREIIREPLDIHRWGTPREREARVRELLELTGLSPGHAERYPHEFSGGQQQRIAIARALAIGPQCIVCDEPVSALDASIQGQILNLLKDLQERFGLAYVFITHDLAVARHVSDRIAVMYLGKIVELAVSEHLFANPLHPYTQALLSAVPLPEPGRQTERIILPGVPPDPRQPPSGCRFHTRCPLARDVCRREEPPLVAYGDGHRAACHLIASSEHVIRKGEAHGPTS